MKLLGPNLNQNVVFLHQQVPVEKFHTLWNFLPKHVTNSKPELMGRLEQYLEERSVAGF